MEYIIYENENNITGIPVLYELLEESPRCLGWSLSSKRICFREVISSASEDDEGFEEIGPEFGAYVWKLFEIDSEVFGWVSASDEENKNRDCIERSDIHPI